jgi:hypothetical protein
MKSYVKIHIGRRDIKAIISAICIALAAYHYGASGDVTRAPQDVVQPTTKAKPPPKPKTPSRRKPAKACKH